MTVYVSTLHDPHNNVPDDQEYDRQHANMFFDLLHKTLLNKFYDHLVPVDAEGHRFPWSNGCYTGIGTSGLNNLRFCCQQVISDCVPGDFLEAGVWRGGAAIAMASISKYYNQNRTIWLLDSFQGMPPLNTDCPHEVTDYSSMTGLAVPVTEVVDAFRIFDVAERAIFVPGWLTDTLPGLPVQRLAVLRLDTDYYESTLASLVRLYPLVSPGGWTIVDDYDCVPGAKTATDQYREAEHITDQMYRMNTKHGIGVYWRKS